MTVLQCTGCTPVVEGRCLPTQQACLACPLPWVRYAAKAPSSLALPFAHSWVATAGCVSPSSHAARRSRPGLLPRTRPVVLFVGLRSLTGDLQLASLTGLAHFSLTGLKSSSAPTGAVGPPLRVARKKQGKTNLVRTPHRWS